MYRNFWRTNGFKIEESREINSNFSVRCLYGFLVSLYDAVPILQPIFKWDICDLTFLNVSAEISITSGSVSTLFSVAFSVLTFPSASTTTTKLSKTQHCITFFIFYVRRTMTELIVEKREKRLIRISNNHNERWKLANCSRWVASCVAHPTEESVISRQSLYKKSIRGLFGSSTNVCLSCNHQLHASVQMTKGRTCVLCIKMSRFIQWEKKKSTNNSIVSIDEKLFNFL